MENTPKVVILAGGRGTRLAEETELKPKPMIEIGDRPILWHIMKLYASRGFTEFYVTLGYKGHTLAVVTTRHARRRLSNTGRHA
jgi:glucose-1-phosphate cytidylyltransferase